jgi:hypothetical protein
MPEHQSEIADGFEQIQTKQARKKGIIRTKMSERLLCEVYWVY